MTNYLPGLQHPDENTQVTSFQRSPRTYTVTAKWWYKPICWITRQPTQRKETR